MQFKFFAIKFIFDNKEHIKTRKGSIKDTNMFIV